MNDPTQYTASSTRYENMAYHRCGKSGLILPRLSFGLWHGFGSDASPETMCAMIRTAFDLGITHFDLADNYGPVPGAAETNFGRILATDLKRHRDELIVSTKAGHPMWPGPYGDWGSRKHLMAGLDQSLRRLGLEYVDIFYHHRPDPETPLEETMGALSDIVRSGKALYVGISKYSAADTVRAAKILADNGTPLVIHQYRHNIFTRGVEADGLFETLNRLGVGGISFSPLAQGLLTDKYLNGIPEGSRATRSVFLKPTDITTAKIEAARKLNAIASARGQTLAEMALAWNLRHAASVIIGASRPEQIAANVKALAKLDFTAEELGQIDECSRSATGGEANRGK